MEKRFAGVAVILFVVVAGCSEPEIQSQASASVSIDGKDQGRGLNIQCNQLQSSWFLDIGDEDKSATAIVDIVGEKVTVDKVEIRGFGDFTGSYWHGGENTADATLINRIFTITGTASGLTTPDQKPGTAKFKITARC